MRVAAMAGREKGGLYNTGRGLEDRHGTGDYPVILGFKDRDDFLRWIDGEVVIDLGSGYGTLAKAVEEAKLHKEVRPETRILSVNQALQDKTFLKRTHQSTRSALGLQGRRMPRFLNEQHDASMLAAHWSELQNIPSGSVGKIVSCKSFPLYCQSPEELYAVMKESFRILKDGGEMRCSDPKHNAIVERGKNSRDIFLEFTQLIGDLGFQKQERCGFDQYENKVQVWSLIKPIHR